MARTDYILYMVWEEAQSTIPQYIYYIHVFVVIKGRYEGANNITVMIIIKYQIVFYRNACCLYLSYIVTTVER